MDVVEAQDGVGLDRPDLADHDVGVGGDGGQQVERGGVEEINLAAAERVVGGRGVGDGDQFDAVDLHHLAAGEAAGRFGARYVAIETVIDQAGARHVLVAVEAEGAGADDLLDGGEGIGQRVLLAQDGPGDAVGAAEQELDVVEGFAQAEREGALVDRLQRDDEAGQDLVLRIAHEQAAERGDDVARGDFAAVMEHQAGAQFEGVEQAVVGLGPGLDHLRPRHHVGIPAEQGIVNHGNMDRGHVHLRLVRVEHQRFGLGDDAEDLLAGLGAGGVGEG